MNNNLLIIATGVDEIYNRIYVYIILFIVLS